MSSNKKDLHEISADGCPVAVLECREPFSLLSLKEKMYAHYITTAGFEGMKICLIQCSYESPIIFEILQRIFSQQSPQELIAAANLTEEEGKQFMSYCAAFYGNMGNYKSFGDSKFIPSLPMEKFGSILSNSAAGKESGSDLAELWDSIKTEMYSLEDHVLQLGFDKEGVTTYYSRNCTKEDAEIVQAVMNANNISGYNTRLFKTVNKNKVSYVLRLASATPSTQQVFTNPDKSGSWDTITVASGDYGKLMQRVVDNLNEAIRYAANEEERAMLHAYVDSFTTGSIDKHKEGSRHWIRDKGPAVESYIGFIENYRDPFGVRGEWEGFAAIVNKEISAKFGVLVDSAEKFLPKLPWPKEFEKDRFLRPDFTSLEVLGFGSSGIPAGINIPNYDDIRQDEGFKNVSLANVLRSSLSFPEDERVTFLQDDDQALYKSTVNHSFDVQVGLHELLGHGSGKLFNEGADGSFNFSRETIDPELNSPVTQWYKAGQTWDSQFPGIGSSYEECRAECVGIYLSVHMDVLDIFGFQGERAEEVAYINWLHMARAGVLALQFYNPGKGSSGWGQAHMMARYAILQVMLEAGQDFVTIHRGEANQNSGKGTYITLDRSKIRSVGVPAIGSFLRKLQVYKSTADFSRGEAMYKKYTTVNEDMLSLREEVIHNRKPRRVFVQHVTRPNADLSDVDIISFEATTEGLIKSFSERYPGADPALVELWKADKNVTKPVLL